MLITAASSPEVVQLEAVVDRGCRPTPCMLYQASLQLLLLVQMQMPPQPSLRCSCRLDLDLEVAAAVPLWLDFCPPSAC